MTQRIQLTRALPEAYEQLRGLHQIVEKAAADAGVDHKLIELVKIRASQLNGCAFCTNLHVKDARKGGETEQRIALLPVWREAGDLFTEQERAALALTDAMTRVEREQDVPDDVYAEATRVFSEAQYAAVAWAATVINAFNVISVTGHRRVR